MITPNLYTRGPRGDQKKKKKIKSDQGKTAHSLERNVRMTANCSPGAIVAEKQGLRGTNSFVIQYPFKLPFKSEDEIRLFLTYRN